MKDIKDWRILWNIEHIQCVKYNNDSGRFCKEAADHRNKRMADWLEFHMSKAKDAYYNSGVPIMSDVTYDNFEDKLKVLRPDSNLLTKVG